MNQPIRILIAEPDGFICSAFRTHTESACDMHVVDEATEAKEAILKTTICQPDVLLLDLALPKQAVGQFIQRLHSMAPHTHILVLAAAWPPYLHQAISMDKTVSYLLKSASVAEWLMAIRILYHGGTVIPFALTRIACSPKPTYGLTAIAQRLSTWRFPTTLRQILPGATR